MKKKREQNFLTKKLSSLFKGLLLCGCFLLANVLSGQDAITISSNDPTGGEVASGAANTASFTISREFDSPTGSLVSYSVTGTSTSGVDHDLADGDVTIIFNGPQSITIDVNILDDDLIESIANETIVVTIDNVLGSGTIDNSADEVTLEILDDDVGVISLSLDEMVVNGYEPEALENGGGAEGQYRLELDKLNATGTTVQVTFTVNAPDSPGPGVGPGDDFDFTGAINAARTRISFPDLTQFRNVNVVPFDDTDPESNEPITITLTGIVGANSSKFSIDPVNNTSTVTIIDDDCAAGDVAPVLNNDPTAFCGAFSVPLDDYLQSTRPPGAGLVWSTNADSSVQADWVPFANDSSVSQPDTYYGFFRDEPNECYSTTVQLVITQSQSPTAGADNTGTACNNDDDTFGDTRIDLDDLLDSGVDTGVWAFVSGPQTLNPDGNNRVQFRNRQAGNYVYSYTTTNAVSPCTNDSATFTITVSDCDPCVAGNTAPVLDATTPTTVCDEFTDSFNDYTNSTAPSGTVLTWSTSSDPTNTNAHLSATEANNPPILEGTYYGFFYDATNSCASPTLQIDLVLNETPTLISFSGDERCGPGVVNLTATATNSATIIWYTEETGGTGVMGVNFNPSINQTTTYYVEATLNGCPSPREEVIATIVPQPSAGVIQNNGNASRCSVEDNGPTEFDLDDVISGQDEGNWVFTSGPVPNFTIPNDNNLDFQGAADGDYVFTYTTSGAQAPCVNESSTITISINDCDVDTDLDGLFDGPEAILGTLPDNPDTDGDGINDGDEVGDDIENPIDTDEDGVIDALDSNIIDSDMDGVVDQLDPGNDNPCVPDNSIGLCDTDEDDIADGVEIAAGSDHLDPCSPNIESPACVNPVPVDLEIKKEVDNPNALVGDEVTFIITLNNLTASKAKAITIGELIENGFAYLSHEASIGTYDVTTGEWNIFEIEPSGSATLTIKVTILEGEDNYSNTAELLSSFPVDNTDENNKATVEFIFEVPEGVNLEIEKKVSLGVGNDKLDAVTGLINTIDNELEVFYFVKVTNKSNQDPVSNIRVVDTFSNDSDLEFDITLEEEPEGTSFDINTGIWQIDKAIEVGEEIELSYRVTFRGAGTVSNTAVIERSSPRESLAGSEDEDSTSTATVTITTRNVVDVGILYNQFSPNNDGLNDNLKINLIRINDDGTEEKIPSDDVQYNIQIFNRYGNLVFETPIQSTEEIWNGSWKGKDSPDGTYFYTMNLQIREEGIVNQRTQKGWIQLVR